MIKIDIDKPSIAKAKISPPKEYLYREFWDEKVLLPEISEALLKIAQSVIQSMEIVAPIKDIIVTGSISGYNWHALSDISHCF